VELIPDLDGWLMDLMEGQPPVPKQYELRCHPDVYLALRDASDRQTFRQYQPDASLKTGASPPLFGSAAIIVVSHLRSGGWELYEDGRMVRSGRLGGGGG
jgi:hypothetical protein